LWDRRSRASVRGGRDERVDVVRAVPRLHRQTRRQRAQPERVPVARGDEKGGRAAVRVRRRRLALGRGQGVVRAETHERLLVEQKVFFAGDHVFYFWFLFLFIIFYYFYDYYYYFLLCIFVVTIIIFCMYSYSFLFFTFIVFSFICITDDDFLLKLLLNKHILFNNSIFFIL